MEGGVEGRGGVAESEDEEDAGDVPSDIVYSESSRECGGVRTKACRPVFVCNRQREAIALIENAQRSNLISLSHSAGYPQFILAAMMVLPCLDRLLVAPEPRRPP